MDTRYWNKEFMTEFIELYRSHPSLWKVGSKDYTNRNLKLKAYNEMVKLCKKVHDKADKNFVTKKIQAIRGSFRKEFKKVEQSKRSALSTDEVYTPTLWYYDLLWFTKDEEAIDSSWSSEVEAPDMTEDTSGNQETLSGDKEEKIITWETVLAPQPQHASTPSSTKREKKSEEDKQQFVKNCTCILGSEEDDDMAFTGYLAAKLRKLDDMQRIYAENLINQVLFKGQLKKLNEASTIS